MGRTIKDIIRGYHIFLPKGWKRTAIYAIFPFVVMGICILAGLHLPAAAAVLLLPGVCILWADGIIYFLVFGGYADKDSKHMEYIKSSARGSALFRRALVADAIRRFGSISLIFLAVLVTVPAPLDLQMGLFFAGAYSMTCLMVFAVSFLMGFLQNLIWAFLVLGIADLLYGGVMILFSMAVVMGVPAGLLAVMVLAAAGLAFVIIRGNIAFLGKRMEGWYYDV